MGKIREIFARNLRENRRYCGFTQAKLAEIVNVSTHYIAMIELAKNIPKGDIIERLANALDIDIYELFLVQQNTSRELKKLHKIIIKDLEQIVETSVETAFLKRDKILKKTK